MSEWKEYHIEDLAEIVNHRRIPLSTMERESRHGIFPYYGASGVIDHVDGFIFDGEHLLISEDGENLKSRQTPIAFLAEGKFWVNNHAHIVKGKQPYINKLLKYYFANLDLSPYLTGAVQPKLNKASLSSIPIWLPVNDQEKIAIAEILSSLDDKSSVLRRQNTVLEEMTIAIYRQLFEESKNEPFVSRPLNDILSFVVDNRGKTAPTSDFGIPLIATNCVKNQNIYPTYDKVRFVSQETYDSWFRANPQPGDILFVNKGTPGCVNLVPSPVDFCIAQDMVALRVNENILSNYYLFLFLRTDAVQSLIINTSVGTTIPHLKKADLLQLEIPIPNSKNLKLFNHSVVPLFEKMNANELQMRVLTQLRTALLPKLLCGEISIPNTDARKRAIT